MTVVGSGPRLEEPGMGSAIAEEKETPHPGDSRVAKVVHRFDKMSYREDIGRRECDCDGCKCGDSSACIEKRCRCCTVSQ